MAPPVPNKKLWEGRSDSELVMENFYTDLLIDDNCGAVEVCGGGHGTTVPLSSSPADALSLLTLYPSNFRPDSHQTCNI